MNVIRNEEWHVYLFVEFRQLFHCCLKSNKWSTFSYLFVRRVEFTLFAMCQMTSWGWKVSQEHLRYVK